MSEHTTPQRVALITGANKGIGRAAAEQLAALGVTVLIGARDPRRGEEAAAAQGAAVVVRFAMLGTDGPTGGFFSEDGPVPW